MIVTVTLSEGRRSFVAGLFESAQVRGLTLANRILVSPMCQYQAHTDGTIADWHMVHYGSLALGGAGLVVMEASAVEARGRITDRDVGLYDDTHTEGLSRIVQFAHQQGAKIGVQLAHAGRKADLKDPIVAPSAVRFSDHYQVPQALTDGEIQGIVEAFAAAAARAVKAGFDTVEIHAAHGYLLHQFLSPISNLREDRFGGTRENRLRFPLQVVKAVRQTVPEDMPVLIRISGSEYAPTGYTMDDMLYYCNRFRDAGVDIIDVSSGGNVPLGPPAVYAGYQVPFAEQIRKGTGLPVVSVGMLDEPVLADAVIREGRADFVAVARGFLRNKHWGHYAAKVLGHPVHPPTSYERAYK